MILGKFMYYKFMYKVTEFEIVNSYRFMYLGILFADNVSFSTCKIHLKSQAERAMFSLLRQSGRLNLSRDVEL